MKSSKTVIITAVLFMVMYAAQSSGAVFEVTNSTELQAALNSARTNGEDDTIKLLAATYTTTGSSFSYGTASNDNHSVTLSGGWNAKFTAQVDDPYATKLDGNDVNPVLQILANAAGVNITFTIENVTILDGYTRSSDVSGAGIEAYTGTVGQGSINLTIRNCLIKDNSAGNNKSGGAIYSNCSLKVYDSKFLSNSGSNGGAMYITYDSDESQSASPIIENCYFGDNSNYGNQGHCIWCNSALQIRNCTFKGRSDGSSSGNGSCIWGNAGSHFNITNSVFSGITIKYWGSAVQVWNSNLDITNCLFANNHAGVGDIYYDSHGAIAYNYNGNPGGRTINITNCTFVGNTSAYDQYTGAIHNRGAIMKLNNCIFWDNYGQSGVWNDWDGSGTITMKYCDYYNGYYGMGYQVTNGGGNFNDDPQLISEKICHLGHWSPCIDAGNNNLVPADTQDLDNDGNVTEPTPLDLTGRARFYDDPCTDDTGLGTAPIVDIGAFEFQPSYFTTFGTVNGKNVKLTLTDCNGNNVTFALTGGGYGLMDPCDCTFEQIELYGTTKKSVLTISTKGKTETSVGNIISDGPLQGIMAKTTDLRGDITIDGSLGTLTLDDVADDHTITIGSSSDPKAGTLMKFDEVSDLTIDSNMPIKTLSATNWASGAINAPSLGSITTTGDKKRNIPGNLIVDVHLNGGAATVKVAGTLSGVWTCDAIKTITAANVEELSLTLNQPPDAKMKILALGTLTVKGWINGTQITSSGNIGTVTTGAMQDSSCFAGVTATRDVAAADGVYDLPDPSADLDERAIIKNIKIAGIKDQDNCFVNSNIAAARIFSAYIAYPKYDNSDVEFGIATDFIKSLTIKDSNGTYTGKNLEETADFPPLPSGGMTINIY
ncbi:MAG: right-handed parallel beta-helix repeat-containing protein [Sedimentisphaerales bacterium]